VYCVFVFSSSEVISPMTDSLSIVFVEFIDGVRLVTEMEADKDSPLLNDIRLHFSRFIHQLVTNTTSMCSLLLRFLIGSFSAHFNDGVCP